MKKTTRTRRTRAPLAAAFFVAVAVAVAVAASLAGCGRGGAGAAPVVGEPQVAIDPGATIGAQALGKHLRAAAELAAGAGVHLSGHCPLAGSEQSEVRPKAGIDERGIFHAGAEQPDPAPAHVLLMLGNLELAEHVLARGRVTEVRSLEDDHIIFKATLELHPADAHWLGRDSIRVAIKPATRGTYGLEYRRELLFYKLGQHLAAAGLIPMIERDIAFEPLEAAIDTQLTAAQRTRLTVRDDGDGARTLHGSMQLWVEGYGPYLGQRKSANRVLGWAAASMQSARVPGERRRRTAAAQDDAKSEPDAHDGSKRKRAALKPAGMVTEDPMWQAISDMIVLDYLVYNSDRSMEAGTVRLADGGQTLVMLDNGDTLMQALHQGRDMSREHFEALGLFSPNLAAGLPALNDLDTLQALLVDMYGKPLVSRARLRRLQQRIDSAARRIARLERAAGDGALFEQPSRARPMRCR